MVVSPEATAEASRTVSVPLMSDLQLLFLVLALLYGWECACWINRGSVAFRSWWGRRWQAAHPGALLGNQRGGFVFAHPLPPLGTVFTGTQFPLSLSPVALLPCVATSVNPVGRPVQNGNCFAWSEIQSLEARGKKVLVNGEPLFKAPSPGFAAKMAQTLRQLREGTKTEREKLIRQTLNQGFDTSQIALQWQEFQTKASSLRFVTNALCIYLFILSPLIIWRFGFLRSWPFLLAALLALTFTTAMLFRRAHKKLFPDAEDERFTHFLIILLSPVTAIRACDVLSRPLLEAYHPLAVAKIFCPTKQFEAMARHYWRELRYPALPICPREDRVALETEGYSRTVLQDAAEHFLKRSGIDTDALINPPLPADDTCLSYCPRCLAQFTTREGICADCGGLVLAPLLTAGPQVLARQIGRRA